MEIKVRAEIPLSQDSKLVLEATATPSNMIMLGIFTDGECKDAAYVGAESLGRAVDWCVAAVKANYKKD